ncbi:MAG TPA: hypothetical protein VHD83_06225 [Puia sp.]|nr:hypothetical protein [Puia sp.]
MRLKAIFFTFVIPILLTSCSQYQYKPSFDCSGLLVGKGIPIVDTLSGPASYHDYVCFFAKHLNIPNIVAGEKDSTLRIWFWQGDTVFVLNIEKRGTAGFGHLLSFSKSSPPPKFAVTITRCSATGTPCHGWERLFDTLRFDNIALMPDGKPNDQLYFDLTGGGRIYIEYQQGRQYRFCSYLEPGYYQFVDSNAAKLHHFLTYLQNEFSLRVYQDLTRLAQVPIRTDRSISQAEYRYMLNNRFIDSGEKVVQLYGDFRSYTAILTDRRIGDYFPRSINLGDSVYEFALIPSVRQVNLNFSTRGPDTVRVTRLDGSNFDLRLGGDRQQLMNFFDSADLVLRRARQLRKHLMY